MQTRPLTFALPAESAAALAVIRRLTDAGHRAYLVGGAVRDLLLGLTPGDFDVATDATPARLLELFPGAHPVGLAFGVVVIVVDSVPVETATFREDGAYSDGRRPDAVTPSDSPTVDARRRDFTVNAMYIDPVAQLILDPAGGLADGEARLLRAVGDPAARFAEDGLRLLRAPRLAAQCGLSIESDTLAALTDCRDGIRRIAAERIGKEIALVLTGPSPAEALDVLAESGLLAIVLPEADAMRGVPQPANFHPEGDVWTHVLQMFRHSPRRSLSLGLAILLHDIAKPLTLTRTDRIRFHGHEKLGAEMTREIGRRLRLPLASVEAAAELTAQHLRFKDVEAMRPSTLKRFLRQPLFDEMLELHRLDCLGSHGRLETHAFCAARLAELGHEALSPPALLRGNDLLAMGYPQGPLIGQILRELETAQLEGVVHDRDEAEAWVRNGYPQPDRPTKG